MDAIMKLFGGLVQMLVMSGVLALAVMGAVTLIHWFRAGRPIKYPWLSPYK